MNRYFKIFIHRGAIFGGFGPIVAAIIYLILHLTIEDFSVSGIEMFSAIISTYIIAFIHAGVSVFNQIEHWSIAKSLLIHFSTLYVTYTLCYLINSWIPFNLTVFLIYTGAFIVTYAIIWAIVVLFFTRRTESQLNSKLNKH